MREVLTTAVAVVLFVLFGTGGAVAFAGGRPEASVSELTVIFDAPQASPAFVRFFYLFNRAMLRWWQSEGGHLSGGRWHVSVSEFYAEDGEPDGVTVVIFSSVSLRRQAMLTVKPIEKTNQAAEIAADVVVVIIETAAKEERR